MSKKTISYTVGADITSEINVEHELYESPVAHSERSSIVARATSKSKQRPQKKVTKKGRK